MTSVIINDILPLTQAIATNGQTVYSTNWTADAASDVVVYSTPVGTAADDVTQILSSSLYSVAFIGDGAIVQVTLITPSSAGDVVTITRMTPADRMNLYTNTNFTPSMLNNDFGILTLVDQQAQLVNQQVAPRYNYSALVDVPADTILPILQANEFWAKSPNNDEIIALNIGTIVSGGTVTQIDTGLGLTGGPITQTGTISFAEMAGNTFWGNITALSALPTQVPTSYFVKASQIGVTVEAWSPALDSIAGLTTSANEIPYLTGSNTYSVMAAAANSVLTTDGSSVPSLASTLPSGVQTNITKLGAQSQALDMNSHQINNLTDPTNPQDAATMAYVTAQTTGAFLPLIGGTMSGIISMGNHKITNVTDPSSSQDAVTLTYLNTQLGFYLPLSGGTMSGLINMGSHKITALLDPTNPQDAATKNYVDSVATGLNVQPSAFAATTTALTVTYSNGASGIGATLTNAGAQATFALDGTSPAVNARVLIKDQSSTFQNGIYTVTNVGSGASNWVLTRATDYDQPSEIQPGDLVIINNGTVNGGASFIETASVAAVGTDPILFSQFTFSATSVLLKANNLSDVANTTTSFNNISPLTTKGDLIGYSSQNVRLAVGATNGQILQVSSGATTGLAWSTASYPVTTTINQLLYSSSTNVVVGLATAVGGVLVTDASGVPQFLANPSANGKILQSVNGAIPAWSTPTYPSTSGTSGKVLVSDGTNVVYSTPTFPNTSAASGKMIVSDGTNWVPSTPTFPNTSATSRKIIISDGTNWVASTETYAAPGASGNILTSNGTNWTSAVPAAGGVVTPGTANQLAYYATTSSTVVGLATGNNGVLVTDGSGVPSISSTLPTNIAATTPKITTGIKDSNGALVLGFTASASAVNYLVIANSATTAAVGLSPTGTDSNILVSIAGLGTSGVQIQGFSNAASKSAGYVGEFITSNIAAASVSLSNNTGKNVGSISLTAGDWDVWGNVSFIVGGNCTTQFCAINTTTDTLPADFSNYVGRAGTGLGNSGFGVPNVRINVSSTTTVYLIAQAAFSTSTVTVGGNISARRR